MSYQSTNKCKWCDTMLISILVIYGSTHAKNLVMDSMNFSRKFKVQHREEEFCDDYFVRLGS